MALGAASGGEQHRGVDQGVEVDQVEQVLEQARIGATVDRRGDQQQVGAFDLVEHRLQFRRAWLRARVAPSGAAMSVSSMTRLSIGSDWPSSAIRAG